VKQPPIENEPELTDEALMRLAQEYDEKFGPRAGMIPIEEAFQLHAQIADELHLPAYKTLELFLRALRKHELVTVAQGFSDRLSVEARKGGTTAADVWAKLGMPEELIEKSEVTSERAVRTLFKSKGDRRRKLDRERKAKKSRPREIFEKMTRSLEPAKAELDSKRRKAGAPKRKTIGKKRKTAGRPR
jgi:hypothetical protein